MNYTIVGGAGFIGSHVARTVLREEEDARVVVFDNFSSGREWHLSEALKDPRLTIVRGEIREARLLEQAVAGSDVVYHFASNPDIAKAISTPDVDFWEGTYLTNCVLEAMRKTGAGCLIYASGSGVYGEVPPEPVPEAWQDLRPISTYGASKLACEALICSYCHMFDMQAAAFRFANVVGPNQTHGVGYDFVRRLMGEPSFLDILGDGTQDKSYIWVEDVISAMRLIQTRHLKGYDVYNVATLDSVTVTQIARMAAGIVGAGDVEFRYAGGDRGWKGDVPIIRMDSSKIRDLGWENKRTSPQAMEQSMTAIYSHYMQ